MRQTVIPKGTNYVVSDVNGPFMQSVDLEFNEDKGDWKVNLRLHPFMSNTRKTLTASFHTLKEAKACVERNKKMWSSKGVSFFDENGVFHSSGNKFYEEAYRSGML